MSIDALMELDGDAYYLKDGNVIEKSSERPLEQGNVGSADAYIEYYETGVHDGWRAVTGLTRQQGGGALMHSSEFLSDDMWEELSRKSPGLYATVSVIFEDEDGFDAGAGWMILHKPLY